MIVIGLQDKRHFIYFYMKKLGLRERKQLMKFQLQRTEITRVVLNEKGFILKNLDVYKIMERAEAASPNLDILEWPPEHHHSTI